MSLSPRGRFVTSNKHQLTIYNIETLGKHALSWSGTGTYVIFGCVKYVRMGTPKIAGMVCSLGTDNNKDNDYELTTFVYNGYLTLYIVNLTWCPTYFGGTLHIIF